VQVLDGLAALPHDARNREQLEWLADEVVEAGGEATIWVGELASAAQERDLASRMAEAVTAEYLALIDDAASARAEPSGQRRRTLGRLRRELRRIRARDYFPPPEREGRRAHPCTLGARTGASRFTPANRALLGVPQWVP
jgi:hypothetical protein